MGDTPSARIGDKGDGQYLEGGREMNCKRECLALTDGQRVFFHFEKDPWAELRLRDEGEDDLGGRSAAVADCA